MRSRTRTFAALLGTAMVALLVSAGSASASFHLMQIRAVFLGPADVSFVELQMYADGQNFVNGQSIDVYNAAGTMTDHLPLNADVASGQNQRTILIADTAQPTTPDFTKTFLYQALQPNQAAGAVCYSNIDCVSWGGSSFIGNALLPSSAGTPIAGGLSTNQVISRSIARGCPTALDPADDTNDTAADFSFGVGFPVRNNSATPTEVLCPASTTPGTTAPTTTPTKKNCKKEHRKKSGAYSAKKHKNCKKKKKH
jgi:hypothetical protein